MDQRPRQEWLAEPHTEVSRDETGLAEGAFLRISTGKIRRREQPLASHQVFLCWGFDGLPVGVSMLEPAPDRAQSTILFKVLASANGASGSSTGESAVVDLPIAFVDSLLHQLGSASASLER